LNRLLIINNTLFLSVYCFDCNNLSYPERLRFLKLNSLQFRRRVADLCFFFNAFCGSNLFNYDSYVCFREPSITRSHQLQIVLPKLNYATGDGIFLVRVAKDWNLLSPYVIAATNSESFRSRLLGILKDSITI
jgi:hypothetical protein